MSLSTCQKIKLASPFPVAFSSEEQREAVKLKRVSHGEKQQAIDSLIRRYSAKRPNGADAVKNLLIIASKAKCTSLCNTVQEHRNFTEFDYRAGLNMARDHYLSKNSLRAVSAGATGLGGAASVVVGILFQPLLALTLPLAIGGLIAGFRTRSVDQRLDTLASFEATSLPRLEINAGTMSELREILPDIESRHSNKNAMAQTEKRINVLVDGNHLVFNLKSDPRIIFKVMVGGAGCHHGEDLTPETRVRNVQLAHRVVAQNNLDLLQVPKTRLLEETVGERRVIAEERLDIEPGLETQEELYRQNDEHLGPVFRQLATFIAKTGFSDVEWRNIPLIKDEKNPTKFRVGLIDLEHMHPDDAFDGLVGFMYRGLIRCSSPAHFSIIVQSAKDAGLGRDIKKRQSDLKEKQDLRAAELQEDAKILAFHKKRRLTENSGELIPQLTPQNIGLCDEVSPGGFAMKDILNDVIETINEEITKNSINLPAKLAKQRRNICVNENGTLSKYRSVPYEKMTLAEISPEPSSGKWIERILNGMADHEYIYKLKYSNGHGYFIQA